MKVIILHPASSWLSKSLSAIKSDEFPHIHSPYTPLDI